MPGASDMQAGFDQIVRGLRQPRHAFSAVRARLRGRIFKLWCRLCRPRISIGRGLILNGKLKIRGPGRVIIGDNVVIGMRVTPFTYAPEAAIEIGDGVYLNGTRFGCRESIRVGAPLYLALAFPRAGMPHIGLQDFHSRPRFSIPNIATIPSGGNRSYSFPGRTRLSDSKKTCGLPCRS